MHVDGKVVLGYPGHVLPGPDVDLGHAVRRVLVQDHCEGAGVHTAAHVLLVRSLKCNIPILNLLYLCRTLYEVILTTFSRGIDVFMRK